MSQGDVASAGTSSHGWQKVANSKRQRRQESKPSKSSIRHTPADALVFKALELHAADRIAERNSQGAPIPTVAQTLDSVDTAEPEIVADKPTKPRKLKQPKASVGELAAGIDPSDLAIFLDDVTECYKSAPDVQLMRFADYFARVFHPITASQFAWDKILRETPFRNAIEIPTCYLTESVIRCASGWLSERPTEELSRFILWLVKSIVCENKQEQRGQHRASIVAVSTAGKSKVGLLMVLALTLRKRPDLLLHNASIVREDPQLRAVDKLAALAWTYGQAAQGDLTVGMSLWVQNLLPLAVSESGTRQSRHITLQFVENVLLVNLQRARAVLLNGVCKKGERLVSPRALDAVLLLSYPSESAEAEVTERFSAIYPLLREVCLAGSFGSKATKPVAQQLLPLSLAAVGTGVKDLSREACKNFIWCLSQNRDCYRQWDHLHLGNLKASVDVLRHLNSNWKDSVACLAPLNELRTAIFSFRSKHHSAMKAVNGDKELEALLREAESLCKAVLRRSSALPGYATATATAIATMALAYGFYLLSPPVNPWNWDGKLLLSKTHSFF